MQQNAYKNKDITTTKMWSLFCVVQLLLGIFLVLEKTNFPTSVYTSQMTLCYAWDLMSTSSFQRWDLVCIESMQALGVLYNLFKFICVLVLMCPPNTASLEFPIPCGFCSIHFLLVFFCKLINLRTSTCSPITERSCEKQTISKMKLK